MEGKKKKRGSLLIAKPDYKKAYVILRNPLSISPNLYPIRIIQEDKKQTNKQSTTSVVEEGEVKMHWLDGKEAEKVASTQRGGGRGHADCAGKFPWSSTSSGGLK